MGIVQSLFGGAKPPLKPTGPAPFAQPNERDRQALFWWLKRNTSYTAIKHNADLWAAFAAEWEKWLRSQDDPYEHLIESYKYILDDQVNYERGLERLRHGDRSVWRRRSVEGWFAKINTGLIDRRMEWDAPPEYYAEHEGVPLFLLRAYYTAHYSAMACSHHGTYRGMAPYLGGATSAVQARRMFAKLSFDTSLPEPRWDVSFAPGKRAPKDGIYEMVNSEGHIIGGLAWFIKGEEASLTDVIEFGPGAVNEDGTDFVWRLLWEDTRYKDGSIPEEEELYPLQEPLSPVEERAAYQQPSPESKQHPNVPANQPCPESGWWFTPAKADSRRYFKQGDIMPSLGGDYGQTFWQWASDQSVPTL